jgi:hypothetical protein
VGFIPQKNTPRHHQPLQALHPPRFYHIEYFYLNPFNIFALMSALYSLIETFNEKQIPSLFEFLEWNNKSKYDSKLLKLIQEFPDAANEELCKKLSPDMSMDAFHSAKQRLHKRVMDFANQQELTDDKTMSAHIRYLETIADRLLRHNKLDAAAEMYTRAAKEAKKYNHLGMYDHLTFKIAKHSEKFKFDVPESIRTWELNKSSLAEKRKLEILRVSLKYEISLSKDSGDEKDADEMISRIFSGLKITPEQQNDPHFMIEITAMSRDAFLSQKKYNSIEPYVFRMYSRLKEAGAFNHTTIACEIEFILMFAHALYRNLKFFESAVWLFQIDMITTKYMSEDLANTPKIIALKSGLLFYTDHLEESITMSENAMKDKMMLADEKEHINMQINLAVYYFAAKRYRDANAMLIGLPDDKYLRKRIGKEGVMKKDMIHMITQYHLGNDDIALSISIRVNKFFAGLFIKPIYQLSGKFSELIIRIFKNRDVLKDPEFIREVEEARRSWPKDEHDLHAIAFYCWLKALILDKDYYEVLLARARRVIDEKIWKMEDGEWVTGKSQKLD